MKELINYLLDSRLTISGILRQIWYLMFLMIFEHGLIREVHEDCFWDYRLMDQLQI